MTNPRGRIKSYFKAIFICYKNRSPKLSEMPWIMQYKIDIDFLTMYHKRWPTRKCMSWWDSRRLNTFMLYTCIFQSSQIDQKGIDGFFGDG